MNTQRTSEDFRLLRVTSGIFGSITLLADVITIMLFMRDLFAGRLLTDAATIASHLVITAIVFTLGLLLLSYARRGAAAFESIIQLFSWLYISLSAMLLVLIAYLSFTGELGAADAYSSLLILAIIIAGLGILTASSIRRPLRNFAIPYMIVAALQASVWVYVIMISEFGELQSSLSRSMMLFIVTGGFIVMFLNEDRYAEYQDQIVWIASGAIVLLVGLFLVIARGWGASLIGVVILVALLGLLWWYIERHV